jgi:hypothetical protein
MRFIVLLFGFFGVLLAALGGVALLFIDFALTWLAEITAEAGKISLAPTDVSPGNAAIFYLLVSVYGLLGVLLAFVRCGKQGGALIVISVLAATLINPIFSPFLFLLGFTGLLCFFIGPLPINPPAKKPVAEDEEELDEVEED